MATIFLDQFSGTGSINGHNPDIGVPNAEWSDIGDPPSAQLVGGHLVAPEVGVTRILSYDYRPAGTLLPIDFPVQGTYSLTFRTGTASEIAYSPGGNNLLFSWSIKTEAAGSTSDITVSATETPGQFLFQGLAAALATLEPETTYVLTWVYETTLDRFSVDSTPPASFQVVHSDRLAEAPYGFSFSLTNKADFDELQVTDTVPPRPVEPTDFLYDDFSGDGPMEGRTPDIVAIPGLTWTDTTPTGSAETLNGNMVTGPGVPADTYASARYGEFATPYYGPLTGEVYAGFLTGPDLSYPVGASGPVVIVEIRFSQSPGTFAVFRLVVNPDGSFTATLGDESELTVLLLPDAEYDLYINYLETEHYISVFDLTNSVSLIDTTYPYTPALPNTGYGATELLVSQRASMTYYEVFGLLQGEVINDADGFDEGVGEGVADLGIVQFDEDVVEAGVADDLALPDGVTVPEDARDAGVGDDAADNQLEANQDAHDGGVGADYALPIELPADGRDAGMVYDANTVSVSTRAVDSGVAEDMADPIGGALLYFEDAVSDGVADDGTNTAAIRNANGRATGIAADFAPNDYYALPRDDGVAADATAPFLNARQIAVDAGVADAMTDTRILQDVVEAGIAEDSTSLAVAVDARSTGVAADRVLAGTFRVVDVRESGVAADAALPLSFVDVTEAGIAADVVASQRRTNQAARSDGVAVDSADPRLAAGAMAVAAGVGNDATNTQLVAYSTVIEAGVGDDAGLFGRLYEAWVMNTQTSAMSRYTSLPFNSAAVIGGRVIGLGDGGFFELGGTTDAGKPIKALMKSGHLTLQSDNIKRLDDMTVGYTSTGTLQVTVAAYGGPLKGRWTYTAPPADAVSPRGNRLTLGRGLQAKYYQFTIENTKGAAMTMDFARVISNEFKSRRF